MAGLLAVYGLLLLQALVQHASSQSFSLSSSTNEITVSWSPNTNQADRFEVRVPGIGTTFIGNGIQLRLGGESTVPGLTPGFTYMVRVYTMNGISESEIFSQRETTIPGSPNVTIISKTTTTVTVAWQPDPTSVDEMYQFSYQVHNSGVFIPLASCPQYQCDLDVGGDGGSSILFRLFAVSNNKQSAPAIAVGYTKPSPPDTLNIVTRTRTSLTISWNTIGSVSYYDVAVSPPEGSAGAPSNVNQGWMYTRSGLTPGTRYRISVVSNVGNVSSDAREQFFYTVPNPPAGLSRADEGATTSLAVTWTKPVVGDCATVTATLTGGLSMNNLEELTTSFTSLVPGKLYNVSVVCSVETNIYSVPHFRSFYTKPLPVSNVRPDRRTDSSLTVIWDESAAIQEYEKTLVRLVEVANSLTEIAASQLGTSRTQTFTSLAAGTQYTVQVYKVSGDQESDVTSQAILTNPESPSGLKQISQSTTSVSVSWTSVTDPSTISGYEISIIHGANGLVIASDSNVAAASTSYQFGELEPATRYIVRLQSFLLDINGSRLASAAISWTVTTDPNAPSNVTVTSRVYTALSFSWTPPVHPVENYVVSIKDGPLYLIKSQVTASSSFQQSSGLKAGTTYIIEVSSRRFNRISSPSTVVVNLRPLPPGEANLVNRTTTSLTVRWTAPPSTDVNNYVIEWEEDGNVRSADVTTTQHQVTGLIGGKQYKINVYSKNNAGERSGTSSTVTATTLPFGVTTIEATSTTDSSLTISWPEPDGSVDFYEVNVKPNHGLGPLPVTIDGGGPLKQTFQGLKPGFTYNVSIISVATRGGIGTPISRLFTTSPAKVLNLRVSDVTTSGMKISWGVDPESRQTSFKVTYKTEEKAATSLDLMNSTMNTGIYGLLPGRAYMVNVTGHIGSTSSDPATITQMTDPLPVINLVANPMSPSEAELQWAANVNSQQDGYQYRYQIRGADSWTPWAGSVSNTVLVNQLYPGQSYVFEIQAKSGERTSTSSSVTTTLLPLPPSDTTVDSKSTTSISLRWTPPTGSIVTGYVAEWMAENQERRTDVTGNQLTVTGLSAGYQYEVNVFSKNSAGERSATSSSVIVTTLPFGVSSIKSEGESTSSITISWMEPPNTLIDRYEVMVDPNDSQVSLPITVLKEGPLRQTFLNLKPGSSYNVTVQSVAAGGGKGTAAYSILTTYPDQVGNIIAKNVSSSEMTVSWEVNPGSVQDSFKVAYNAEGKPQTTLDIRSSSKSARISSLLPGRTYTINVTASSNGRRGQGVSVVQTTDPLPPSGFKAQAMGSTEVTLIWVPNGNSKEDGYQYRQKIDGTDNWTTWVAVLSSPVTITDFYPGMTYNFEIESRSLDRTSMSSSAAVTLLPLPPVNPRILRVTATSMTVVWIPPPNSEVSGYVLEWTTNSLTKRTNVRESQLKINGLLAGQQYTISIFSRNRDNAQSTAFTSVVGYTLPFGVSNIETGDTSEDSVTVSWAEPSNSDLEYYEIMISPNDGRDELPITVAKNGRLVHTFLNLKAGTTYNVSVQTVAANGGRGALVSRLVLTRPLAPHSANLVDKSTTAVALNWSAPAGSEVAGYDVEWMVNGRPRTSEAQGTVHQISGLMAGQEYTFRIFSKNRAGQRSVGSTSVNATTLPFGVATMSAGDKDTESITVTWPEPANTNVAYYELRINPNPESLPLPLMVPGTGPLRKVFNGLAPGETYNVTIQPVASDGGKGSPMSVAITTEKETRDLYLMKIILPCVIGGLLLLGLIIALLCCLHRKRSSSFPDEDFGPVDAKFNSVRRRRIGGDSSRPIRVGSFMDHYKRMSADANLMFSDEFQDLATVAKDMTTTAGELPSNRGKNRFTNILPFDQTRVKLMVMDHHADSSDYINANYVPGFDSKREFIACQGPLPTTKVDFWRMIWEQYACAIVMLTECVERGREKCDHYWPVDTEPVYYGDLQVTVMNESKSPEWTISDLRISKGETQRKLTHFHHSNWPDFGIPSTTQSLVKFIRQFRSRVQPYGSPVVVHCSSGAGRAGVFIALDNLLYQYKDGNYIDVFGTIHEMRMNRMAMVQTEEQYIYLYRSLAYVIEGKEDDPPPYPGKDSKEIKNSIAF